MKFHFSDVSSSIASFWGCLGTCLGNDVPCSLRVECVSTCKLDRVASWRHTLAVADAQMAILCLPGGYVASFPFPNFRVNPYRAGTNLLGSGFIGRPDDAAAQAKADSELQLVPFLAGRHRVDYNNCIVQKRASA